MRCLAVGLAVCVTVSASVGAAGAHQSDTSYARVRLDAGRIETTLTFDLHVLGRIAPIDRNDDGTITPGELRTAAPELQAYLGERIRLSLDDGPPSLGSALPPVWPNGTGAAGAADWQQTLVDFGFRRSIATHPRVITLTFDTWSELGPAHTDLASIEQAGYDPLEVAFTQDEPDFDYFTETPRSSLPQLARFVRLGAVHIWGGLDHILFLAALLVASQLRQLLRIVTAFTVAHSITLALAVLGLVELPPRLVEAAIAGTIVWVAYQNLRGRGGPHRWRSTFAFGLVHGFGFAGVLRELDLGPGGLLRALAGFNVGVEIGQILLVAALLPATMWLARTRVGPVAVSGVSACIGIAGLVWLVQRTFGLAWIPA